MLVGFDAELIHDTGIVLIAGSGAFILTGQDADLIYVSIPKIIAYSCLPVIEEVLIGRLTEYLMEQLKWVPEDWFDSKNKIFYGVNNMIEDMIDTGEKLLGESAEILGAYLKEKMII